MASVNVWSRRTESRLRLEKMVEARVHLEESMVVAVSDLLAAGAKWPEVADILGMTRQGARLKYRERVLRLRAERAAEEAAEVAADPAAAG